MQVSERDRAPAGAAVPCRFGVRAGSMARVTVWALLLGAILMPRTGEAQDATWSLHPVSNDWTDPANWSSNFTPTGIAIFGASSQTAIRSVQGITSVGTIVLNSDAPAYRFSAGLNFTDRGIVNNSNFAPVFDSGVSFSNASSAGNATINSLNSIISEIFFFNTSSAGNAHITNGFSLSFEDNSTAANAVVANPRGGDVIFAASSTAANASLTNNSLVNFEFSSTAANASITNFGNRRLFFGDASSAGNATIINNAGGQTFFNAPMRLALTRTSEAKSTGARTHKRQRSDVRFRRISGHREATLKSVEFDPTPTLLCAHRGHTVCSARWSDWRPGMRCLRIYATPDGESHFGEVDIAITMKPAFPNKAPFEISAFYPASRIRFSHIPAGVREVGFHNPPDRLLAIWLDGHVEFETSDGEVRRLPAGKAVLVEDTHGRGHISRHPEEGQNAIIVMLPSGLDAPLD